MRALMMFFKKKSSVSRKRGSARSAASSKTGTIVGRGFWSALILSALTSFQMGSSFIDPSWNARLLSHLPVLATLYSLVERYVDLPPSVSRPQAQSGGAQYSSSFTGCRKFFPDGEPPLLEHAQGSLRELCFDSFAILHNGSTKTPVFVAERLNRAMLQKGQGIKRTDRFYAEARLPSRERAELSDYKGSGYARGHLAAAGNMSTQNAMAQSFSLANMVPQNQSHNSGPWNKIESDTRKYIMRAKGDVYVFTGAFYGNQPKVIGANKVAVPTHLFKLIYDASTGKSWAHWQQNQPGNQVLRPISYSELVARTGIHFLK